MKTTDFYGLAPDVQDRLRWSMRGQFDPKPLLFQAGSRSRVLPWLSLSGLAAAALLLLWSYGLGDPSAALARHPTAAIAAYVALTAAMALGVVQAIAHRARVRCLPFTPGLYLFGASLVDARDRKLRTHGIDALREVVARGNDTLVLTFDSGRFVFRVAPGHLDRAATLVRQSQEHVARGLGRASRYELDPFEPPALAIPLPPLEAPVARPPRWPRFAPALAVVFGALGAGLFVLRDDISDQRMFEAARARDDVPSYERYLARGERHRDEVARRLLPRAALRGAVKMGTVEAIDAFEQAYPVTDIGPEIEAARRAALKAAFERARSEGSLTSLASFAQAHPHHHLEAPFREAMKSVYRRALDEVRAKMPPGAKRERELVAKIISWAEGIGARSDGGALRGPAAAVRFRQLPSKAMDRADELVRQSSYYGGDRSLPSGYVDRAHLAPLEQEAATALARAFSSSFRPEVLTFAAGPAVEGELDRVEVPTIVMSYRVEPSGQNYASKKPRGIYVGLVFFGSVELWLPGAAEPTSSRHVFPQPILVKLLDEQASGPLEASLYRGMMQEALGELNRRYLAEWFRP